MKVWYRFLFWGLLSLLFVSCNKDKVDDLDLRLEEKSNVLALTAEFEGDEELRASIMHRGKYRPATTSFKAGDFGKSEDKIKAHWAVVESTTVSGEISECVSKQKDLKANSLWIEDKGASIQGAKMKMYIDKKNIPHTNKLKLAWIGLDGNLIEDNKLEFQWCSGSDPNCYIKGSEEGSIEEERHLPVMTKFLDYEKFRSDYTGVGKVTFRTRGSLLGLIVENKCDLPITILNVSVKREACPLSFSGYFDLNQSEEGEAPFYGYDIESEWWDFSIGADGDGQVLDSGKSRCFYIWGYPTKTDASKCKMRITYLSGKETRIRNFDYKLKEGKVFKDGETYRVGLKVKKNNRGILREFKNPLDFVANGNVAYSGKNLAGIGKFGKPFTNSEAKALFIKGKPLADRFILPNRYQWQSIVPFSHSSISTDYIYYGTDIGSIGKIKKNRELSEMAQVGDNKAQMYDSEFIGVNYTPWDKLPNLHSDMKIYAVRFKGDPQWESAWCYYKDKTRNLLVIKCRSLIGQKKSLEEIKEAGLGFFEDGTTTRYFAIDKRGDQTVHWSREEEKTSSYVLEVFKDFAQVFLVNTNAKYGYVRPFYKGK